MDESKDHSKFLDEDVYPSELDFSLADEGKNLTSSEPISN